MSERDLFLAALDIDDLEQRARFLVEQCGADEDRLKRLNHLLLAKSAAGSFLESAPVTADDMTQTFGASSAAPTSDHPSRDEHAGAILGGKYKLIEEIGEGGMGSVYMAQQTEPVKRLVAVKVIKAGMDSKAVLARFEAERQALAMMDHPNIAKVLDAGTTGSGRPYFVMELVKGVPITQYCDERKLTPRQRLELFVPVCAAIQHAHMKGVIHRDIKPSNVLVALYDDKPVPKVIDFGVAKAAGQSLTDMTLVTGFGAVVGTPEYMSPEQANLNNLDIDTRSDVYSLGVLLYELLTGSTPVDRKSLGKAALLEILRIVREVEAPKPSAKLSTIDTLPSIAACRGTEPAKLSKLMRGELDWVVLKALEKDRTRRYDTANGLARDIQRYLADEIVEARPPSAAYRLKKFVRRHKGQVIAASLVLFVLVAGMAGTTWGLFEARRQEQEARKQEQLARDETAEKEKARLAEAERVQERDAALRQEAERVKERDVANNELTHRLGISNYLLAVAAYDNRDVVGAAERLDKVPADQRGWEWAYLKRLTRGGIFTLYGHTDTVSSVSFSPDGTRIVTGSWDGTAKVWDAGTGTPLLGLKGHKGRVSSVSLSPDGAKIVTGSYDGTAKVWDACNGTLLFDLKGHTDTVRSVSFSPDGSRIATGSWDKTAAAKVWDAHTGAPLFDLKGLSGTVWSVSFSPDGTRIVTGSGEWGVAKVWDARTGTFLFDLKGHTSTVYNVSFSPDGMRIVTGSMDKTAKVWDARTGTHLLDLMGHTNAVVSVGFSPDGARIVTGSTDKTAKVWDASTGTPRLDLKGHSGSVSSVSLSTDGTRIVTGSWDKTARVWDARTGASLFDLKGHSGALLSVSFSPDGSRIVTGTGYLEQNKLGEAKVWDARNGMLLFDLKGHTGGVSSVSFSPDGTRIVTGGGERDKPGVVKVWDARNGTLLFVLKGHTNAVVSMGFSPDGTRIVTGGGEQNQPGEAKVWDAHTGTLLFDLKGHTDQVCHVGFSPDGTRIVTGSGDKTAKVWDARTGTPLLDLKGHSHWVYSVSFSPDGKRIVTGGHDQTAKVWDARTGTPLLDLKGHSGWVSSVAFGADGTRLVTGSFDKTAKVWDTRIGQELKGDRSLDDEERDYRLLHTRPNHWHFAEGYDAARQANDPFATRFYLDRLIEFSTAANKPDEVKKWRAERAKYPEVAPPPREKK